MQHHGSVARMSKPTSSASLEPLLFYHSTCGVAALSLCMPACDGAKVAAGGWSQITIESSATPCDCRAEQQGRVTEHLPPM